jgi:hypothetical protein
VDTTPDPGLLRAVVHGPWHVAWLVVLCDVQERSGLAYTAAAAAAPAAVESQDCLPFVCNNIESELLLLLSCRTGGVEEPPRALQDLVWSCGSYSARDRPTMREVRDTPCGHVVGYVAIRGFPYGGEAPMWLGASRLCYWLCATWVGDAPGNV